SSGPLGARARRNVYGRGLLSIRALRVFLWRRAVRLAQVARMVHGGIKSRIGRSVLRERALLKGTRTRSRCDRPARWARDTSIFPAMSIFRGQIVCVRIICVQMNSV